MDLQCYAYNRAILIWNHAGLKKLPYSDQEAKKTAGNGLYVALQKGCTYCAVQMYRNSRIFCFPRLPDVTTLKPEHWFVSSVYKCDFADLMLRVPVG